MRKTAFYAGWVLISLAILTIAVGVIALNVLAVKDFPDSSPLFIAEFFGATIFGGIALVEYGDRW